MQELIEKIISQTGISHEQANGALSAIKNFVSEKFPMLSGHLDSILGGNTATTENNVEAPVGGESILEKVTHFAQEHAGDLKGNAGNLVSEAEEKLKGLFN